MKVWKGGGFALRADAHACVRPLTGSEGRRGVVLLAVLVFIALLLPLITLVLTSINTESVATAEAINSAKSEMAAEKALNDAISLVVLDKSLPSYYSSATQPDTAVIVQAQVNGQFYRRNQVPDGGGPAGAGPDGVLGTGDDFWIGPRLNGSFFGGDDDATSSRNFGYDFAFVNKDAPTYLGQGWSFSSSNEADLRSPFSGGTIWFLNQFAATSADNSANGVDDGYNPSDPFPFPGDDPFVYGPGYYLHADEPRDVGALGGGPVARTLEAGGSNSATKAWLLNAKVNLYESVFSDLGRGPIPSNLLKSYANITDESGRLNLNIFAKKLRVWASENSDTDYDFEGYPTDDFNLNTTEFESGWKWVNNPLFPDKDSTRRLRFEPVSATFTDLGPIDFGSMRSDGTFGPPDGFASLELGETVQHFYAGDTTGNGIPDSIESMRNSIEMLMTLPGIDGAKAVAILEYLNPSQDYFTNLGGAGYYNPSTGTWPPLVDPSTNPPTFRQDAMNLTPALVALEADSGATADYRWNFGGSGINRANYDPDNEDDLPLPPPRTLQTIEELINVRGSGPLAARISERDVERIRNYVTVHSYDTNVLANYVQDVPAHTDMVNAYVPGDPEYSGASLRQTPVWMLDQDNVPDLRYDVDRFVFAFTLSDYRETAEEMYAHLRNHLPRPLLDKITLPVVDRMGRAGAEDHLTTNSDPKYNPAAALGQNATYVPHRDGDTRVYNVGRFGREDDPDMAGPIDETGYPALNPEFSLDSCLSAVLYRNGTVFEEDDYSYNPDDGSWRPVANRGLQNFFPFGLPWFLQALGPFANQFNDIFQTHNNPYSDRGNNVNAQVPAHGRAVFTPQNMLQYGSFDSTADLLNVPLYEFTRMSVSLMADPPSGYRFDAPWPAGDGTVDTSNPDEFGFINYSIAFSDVVDVGWYLQNVDPDGPDGRAGTADDPDENRVLYKARFTPYNRPGVNFPSDPGADSPDAVEIDITAGMLRALGGGAEAGRSLVTIAAYDNIGNRNFLWANPNHPQLQDLALPLSWRDVPRPEAVPGSHASARPDNPGDWPGGQPSHWQAWAYDGLGDPYMTSRVEVVKWDPDDDVPATPEARTDEIAKVYVQFNENADIPFMASILPVRISGDEYELRSSVGGYQTQNGAYILYDWSYEGLVAAAPFSDLPGGYDGAWPPAGSQPAQAPDPRVIRARLTDTTGTIALRVYDLREFDNSPAPGVQAPAPTGYPALQPLGIWDNATGRVEPPPQFPDPVLYGGNYPPNGTPGYTVDVESVQIIETAADVIGQVTVEEPTIFADDDSLRVTVQAAGGELPYTYQVSIYDPLFGEPTNPGTPYLGPDGLGDINTFPGLATPPRPSRVDGALNNARAYSAAAPVNALWRRLVVAGTNEVEEEVIFRPASPGDPADINGLGAMPPGLYWVELRVTDVDGNPVDYSYSKLAIGTDSTPATASGLAPHMNLSIGVQSLTDGAKGFRAVASTDGGGASAPNLYWEVRRPLYDNNTTTPSIIGEEVVNASAPFIGLTSGTAGGSQAPMTSHAQAPTFQFVPGSASDGVYFVHCWALKQLGSGIPGVNSGNVIAHDVALVTLHDFGTSGGGPALDGLARTPMAVLAAGMGLTSGADPQLQVTGGPGNLGLLANAPSAAASSQPQASGASAFLGVAVGLNLPVIDTRVAARGDYITIRGFNFAPNPADNLVRFHGGATSRGIAINLRPEFQLIGGNNYQQQELLVRVPGANDSTDANTSGVAQSGWLQVEAPGGGRSAGEYFQTGFEVTFTAVGTVSDSDSTFLQMEIDFQGDGRADVAFDSSAIQNSGGVMSVTHDYARDGFGNYAATLIVTDTVSGRRQVSRQLITIADRTASTSSIVRPEEILASIWPEIDIRSETFTPGSNGTVFESAVGGPLGGGLLRKWKLHDGTNRSAVGGELIAFGCVTDPDVTGRRLIDTTQNFTTVSNRGVQPGDLAIVYPNGIGTANQSEANVLAVETATTLLLGSPGNSNIGLTGGGPVTRSGHADNAVPSATELFDQQNNLGDTNRAYDFTGDACKNQGGLLPGDIARNVTTGATGAVVATDSPAEGILQTGVLSGGIAIGGPKGAGRPVTSGGTPSAGNLLVGQAWQSNGPPLQWSGGAPFPGGQVQLGDTVEMWQGGTAYDTVSGVWIGGTLVGSGTVTQVNVNPPGGNRAIRTGTLTGWLPDPTSNQRYVIKEPGINGNLWRAGDLWEVNIPADQLRRGYEYEIYTFNGFEVRAESDADYATENAIVEFDLELTTPFDLSPGGNHASRVHVDWNGDGTVDQTYLVGESTRSDNAINEFEHERVRLRHGFTAAEMMPVPPLPFQSQAQFRVEVWERGQANSRTFPNTTNWYQLPSVLIGGDDFDTELVTLNTSGFDSSGWRTVGFEAQTARGSVATDQLLIPPGVGGMPDRQLTSFVSYDRPYFTNNTPGITLMRHQGVHGAGGALNWMADSNADGRWFNNVESPLGNNPANFHQFIFPNGDNQLAGPPVVLRGASFPLAAPGVGTMTTAGFQYIVAGAGIYNGYGYIADNLPQNARAFSFDSQAVFLADRQSSAGSPERRPLGADFQMTPLVGTSSQIVSLTSFVTGGISNEVNYNYQWQVVKLDDFGSLAPSGTGPVGIGGPYSGVSSTSIHTNFELGREITDEGWYTGGDAAGNYRVWLRVSDGAETVLSASRDFRIVPIELRPYIMADPPSTSVGSTVTFHVFVDGGIGPYLVEIDREGDGIYETQVEVNGGNMASASTQYTVPGNYDAQVRVTDSSGGTPFVGQLRDGNPQEVRIADTIPLNASLLVNPPSGVAPFLLDAHYSVSGGSPLSGNEYNVSLQLINTDGSAEPAVTRRASTSLGADRMPDDPRRPGGDDDPVRFVVPSAGNYFIRLTVTDNNGAVVSVTEDVFAAGYIAPESYGDSAPRIARDGNGRPLHAFRVWVDPFLNLGPGQTNPNAGFNRNINDGGAHGGRLMEADLQVIGDAITTDPNPSFRSLGVYAAADPATQPLYGSDYGPLEFGGFAWQDHYDTFTPGRININTASEEVLTALFKRIIKTRAYHEHDWHDLNGDGQVSAGEIFYWKPSVGVLRSPTDLDDDGVVDWPGGTTPASRGPDERVRFARDPENDVYLTEQEARDLARSVVTYRSAFYDMNKPTAPGASGDFGYRQSGYSASPVVMADLGLTLRADHLPVIGPWDGVNPHDYAVDERDADLRSPNAAGLTNAWDNMAASYYNFDGDEYMFYSPTDIAVVRERWRAQVNIDLSGIGGGSFAFDQFEPAGNYAKYLNDTVTNRAWGLDRGPFTDDWADTGLYPFDDHYSRWSFDARNYFTYAGGEYDVDVNTGTLPPSVTWTQTSPAGTPGEARNRIGIIESNGEVAYSYIPNPPFRSLFDLFKVINALQEPMTFSLDSNGQMEMFLLGHPGVDPAVVRQVGSTWSNVNNSHENAQVFSGPSVFRYAAHWDGQLNEFIPVCNYLDDIAPFVTCRSYVFRVEASGGVSSGDSGGTSLDSAKIRRDRTFTAVIDTGKMYANRSESASGLISQLFGGGPTQGQGYRVLASRTNSR